MVERFNKKEYDKQWWKDNPEKAKQYRKNRAKRQKEYMRQWRKDNPEYYKAGYLDNCKKIKKQNLKKRHRLSYEDWQKMWDNQNEKCLICGEPFISPQDACIDHNHKTGKVRGLLCFKCNCAIGLFNDNPKSMAKAIEYLLGRK